MTEYAGIEEYVKGKRKEMEMNQTEFGEYLGGFDQHTISRWERGETSPTYDTVVYMVKKLGGEVILRG